MLRMLEKVKKSARRYGDFMLQRKARNNTRLPGPFIRIFPGFHK
jgi:hypothetical protein